MKRAEKGKRRHESVFARFASKGAASSGPRLSASRDREVVRRLTGDHQALSQTATGDRRSSSQAYTGTAAQESGALASRTGRATASP
jgi:hypothetical protein